MRLSELEKPLYAVYMFKTLFADTLYALSLNSHKIYQYSRRFDTEDLIRFVLTVRKNYRRVAYHNWAHGWSVAHAMFATLMNSPDAFTKLEVRFPDFRSAKKRIFSIRLKSIQANQKLVFWPLKK